MPITTMKKAALTVTVTATAFLLMASAAAQDFCVADTKSATTPSGYPCRAASSVTTADFVFTGLAKAGAVNNIIGAAVTPAFTEQFPGVNGLGISAARLDLAPGGVIPLHIHPGANEVLLVTQGYICAGFISSDNHAYSQTLTAGQLMVFPRGLLHYQINVGNSSAVGFPFFSNPEPGLQIVPLALFKGDIPSPVIAKTTFLSPSEIQRLKKFLGGKN